MKPIVAATYHHSKVLVLGGLSNTLLTDVAKYSVGRLRPHFMAACVPDIDCEINSKNYITEFQCIGNKTLFPDSKEREKRANKASRLSFYSGHASSSWFGMTYAVLFLQYGLRLDKTRLNKFILVKPLVQIACIIFALFTSCSRVSDYKHHPEDVVVGSVLGAGWALLASNFKTVAKKIPRRG